MAVTEKYTSSYIAVAQIDGKEAYMHMEAYDHVTAARESMSLVREAFPNVTAFDVEIRDRFSDDFDRLTQMFHVKFEKYAPGMSRVVAKATSFPVLFKGKDN